MEAARSLFESARATWLAASYRVGAALATANLGRLEARAGNVVRGRGLLEEALGDFREIRSPVFIAETEVHLNECQVLEGDFAAATATARELLARFRGGSGLEQVELTTLRLLGVASGFASLAKGPVAPLGRSSEALNEAIQRATALEAPYELALALSSKAMLDLLIDGAGPSLSGDRNDHATAELDRAGTIFDSLGVSQAVITWSTQVPGGPIFARQQLDRGDEPSKGC